MIRNSMLRWTAAVLPLMAAATTASAQQTMPAALPPAATLVAKFSAAVGGPAFLNAKSIVTKGTMSMPAAGINATIEMTQLAPNLVQMATTIPGMGVIQIGFDGTTGWSVDPMQGPRLLTGKELAQVKDDGDRRSAVRSPELFTSLQTVADTTMNSERCYLVKLTWKSGREMFDCYSVTSGLMVASRSVQNTAMGDIPVVTLFSDYKKMGDVTIATKAVQEAMGQQQILTITSVEFGNGAGVTIAPPPAVQALAKPTK